MARYRLSGPAQDDVLAILKESEGRHGVQARRRYRALLTAAMRRIARDPLGPLTIDRSDLVAGFRSFHIRHSRDESLEGRVRQPVHVLFYRQGAGPVEIMRVLHERMEPKRHIGRL